jgi:hypothetical protein
VNVLPRIRVLLPWRDRNRDATATVSFAGKTGLGAR